MASDKRSRLEQYAGFCATHFVPVFSQPWWMDAVCKPENWDVWLCCHGDEVVAAMPFYRENRGGYPYITKATLTQNNGIIFSHGRNSTLLSRQKAEEKIISEACEFIDGLDLAVYEQQYHHSFSNWSPFFWKGYEAIPRYTYVIQDASDLEAVWGRVSSKQRAIIKKGRRSIAKIDEAAPDLFYEVHKKVFDRQGLVCPFSMELWMRLWAACQERGQGKALCSYTESGEISSFVFLVWDDRSVYQILGGSTPGLQQLDTYGALIWKGIELAHEKGLSYDFEGSMIERIARSFREYGAEPKLYFRIRKVFEPEVVLAEANQRVERMKGR